MPPFLLGAIRHLRYAVRTISRSPVFAGVAILTLALGIGGSTAAFSIMDPVLLRGLPYHAPDRLRTAFEQRDDGGLRLPSYPTVRDWQQQLAPDSSLIEGVAFVRGNGVTLPGPDEGSRVVAAYVSPEFFRLTGTRPLMGRVFTPAEDRPGAAAVAVISYDLFMDRFGGDRGIVGRSVDVDSVPTTIIGVMPRNFGYPNWGGNTWFPTAIWQPLSAFAAAQPEVLTLRGLHADSRTLIRLRPGVDSARAAATMHVIQARIAAEYPADEARWTSVALEPLEQNLFGSLPQSMLLVSGAIALVLLLGCANVANLFLVRGSVRGQELAVRTALGAGRAQLVGQLFAEAVVIAAVAGALGVLLAAAFVGYARHAVGAMLPFTNQLSVNTRALAFATGISLATALLIGLGPALRASRGELMSRIRGNAAATVGHRRERRLRNLLVSLQFAVALTLLAGSGLLIQSFRRLLAVPLGYDPSGVVRFAIAPGSHAYDSPQAAAAFYARVLQALDAIPGVQSSATTQAIFFTKVFKAELPTEGQPVIEGLYNTVSPGYRRTYRISMVAGRWFTDQDMRSPDGLVISDRLAHRLFGDRSALNQRITIFRQSQGRADFGQPITLPVIGVAAAARDLGPASAPVAEVYLPYTLEVWPWMNFAVRASNPSHVARAIKSTVLAVDASTQFRDGASVTQTGFGSIDAQTRFVAEVLAGFAVGALLLAAIGLYGVVAYGVSQRTREIGIRIALGATDSRVMRLVLRDGVTFVLLGAAAGLAGAFASTRLLRAMLFQTTTTDPATFVVVTLVLAGAAIVATYLPARRATRTDPTIAIRAE